MWDDASIAPSELRVLLNPTIEKMASLYQVDPRWIKAIITQESQWHPFAVRYESGYTYLFQPERFVSGLNSIATEVNTQKMSFGLGQVMGALAREQGHRGLMCELLVPEVNIRHMAIRLLALKRKVNEPEYIFAGYNGGYGAMRKQASGQFKNQAYVTAVQKYMNQLLI